MLTPYSLIPKKGLIMIALGQKKIVLVHSQDNNMPSKTMNFKNLMIYSRHSSKECPGMDITEGIRMLGTNSEITTIHPNKVPPPFSTSWPSFSSFLPLPLSSNPGLITQICPRVSINTGQRLPLLKWISMSMRSTSRRPRIISIRNMRKWSLIGNIFQFWKSTVKV
jgi:hypothetical protein